MAPPSPSAAARTVAFSLPIAAALFAYVGSLDGGLVFDDIPVFVENRALSAGHWWEAAFGATHTALANRPFTCWTFAMTPAVGGSQVTGYRVGNLLLHVASALLLLGVVRRCLLAPNLSGRFTASRATWIATTVATLWACHPLGVDAVAYVTQRTTLLMSCCFLVALYATLRRWRAVVIVALALGMASKEEFVAAPLLIVLFERAFLLPDWRALRGEARYHAALAATWLVLATCVVLGPSNETVGFGALQKVTAFEWLMTQAGVILHYLRLVVVPYPLRGAYDCGIVRNLGSALLPLLAVGALFVAVMWQWRTRPWLAWLGTMFFLLLGPTSSLMPIVTEVAAERRMYLPMLAVLVPLVLAVEALLRRHVAAARLPLAAAAALAVVTVPFVFAARCHAAVFRSEETFWTTAYEQNELTNGSMVSSIVLGTYAQQLQGKGRHGEALPIMERAMRCEARMWRLPIGYAGLLRDLGRLDDSERVLRELIAAQPELAAGHGLLALVLTDRHEADAARGLATAADPRLAEAAQSAERACAMDGGPWFLNNLGVVLWRQGRLADAEAALSRAVALDPTFVDARRTLGAVLCHAGRPADGIAAWQQALVLVPQDADIWFNIAQAHLQTGDRAAAAGALQECLRLQPGNVEAQQMLQQLR